MKASEAKKAAKARVKENDDLTHILKELYRDIRTEAVECGNFQLKWFMPLNPRLTTKQSNEVMGDLSKKGYGCHFFPANETYNVDHMIITWFE